MKTPFKHFLLFAVIPCLVALACQTLGISPQPENEGLQSTIFVPQTQLAEIGIPTQEGIEPTAEPGGELAPTPEEGQPPIPGMDLPAEPGMETNFEFLGQIGGSAYAVVMDGGIAYLGQGPRLVTLDVSTPSFVAASPMAFANSPGLPKAGSYLFVGGLMVYDVADVSQPKIAGVVQDVYGTWTCDVVDDIVYIVTQMQGLHIYRFKPLG